MGQRMEFVKYCLVLRPETPALRLEPELGYRLYASLLEQAEERFARIAHANQITPVSQYLSVGQGEAVWHITLFGRESIEALSGTLEKKQSFFLRRHGAALTVTERESIRCGSLETLFRASDAGTEGFHRLSFQTPVCFKKNGRYQNIPTVELIIQNLVRRWNAYFPDAAIEDTDGGGLEAIAAGLYPVRFCFSDKVYGLKSADIPGCIGSVVLQNRLGGFHRQLADTLLYFSQFSGIGIKTSLGLGGVEHEFL